MDGYLVHTLNETYSKNYLFEMIKYGNLEQSRTCEM